MNYTRLEDERFRASKKLIKVKRWNEVKVKTLLKLKKPIAKYKQKRASLLRAHVKYDLVLTWQ